MTASSPQPTLRERLRDGRSTVATFSIIPAVEVVEIIALSGFDAVILDTEHGPYGVEEVGRLVIAAHAHGCSALVRVRAPEASLVGAALDAGADGVLVPQIGNVGQARAAVSAARFAPQGTRGANPYVRAGDFMGDPTWFRRANDEVAAVLMIEGLDGIAAMPEIMKIDHLDAVFVGPVDLSHALGVPGETDHPDVVAKVSEIVECAKAANIATGVFAPSVEAAQRWLNLGVVLVALGVDTGWLSAGLRQCIEDLAARPDQN